MRVENYENISKYGMNLLEITDCVCTYDGKIFAKIEGVRKEIFLKECKMPFKTKQRTSA